MTDRKPATKENRPKLEDELVEAVRDWVRRSGPRIAGRDDAELSLRFILHTGREHPMTLDDKDETPYCEVTIVEQSRIDTVHGWVEE